MTVAALAIAFVVLAAVTGVLALELIRQRDEAQAPKKMRLYAIAENGETEVTLEGVFLGFEADHYRLAAAVHVRSDGEGIPLDGEAWIPQTRVLYAQIVG